MDIYRNSALKCGLDSTGSGYSTVEGSSEQGNELFGSVEGGDFHNQLSENQLLNKDSAPVSQLISSLRNESTERGFGDVKA